MTSGDEIARFREVEALFDAASQYPSGPEREAFLAKKAATDAGLADEVRELLEDDERRRASAPAASEALPAFGPWKAVRVLGRGGMGVVYLAERADGAFEMRVAVKVVPLALASPGIEERFRRERQFLASLDHPNIARLIDGGVTGAELPYLVMEYVNGVPIDGDCDARRLDARGRIALMRQVLEALGYVHSQNVIHRDLKPSNILVDAEGRAKLLDFGTARLVNATGDAAITKTGVFAFTPEYASPEQALGRPVSFASDIYSVGVLLYRLLTGSAPYQLTGEMDAVADTILHAHPDLSGLDGPLAAILSKSLDKNPANRYQSAAEMDADLVRYLEDRPVEARRARKIPAAAAIVALLALCAAAWAIVHFVRKPGAPDGPPSIAVLPFRNLSGAPDAYLAAGIASELRESLSRHATLRVIAGSSVAGFADNNADLRKAGRVLKVTRLLTGSLERTGDRIKVVATLLRASDGEQVWTNTYRRSISNLSAIEAELDNSIAASLGIASSKSTKKHVPKDQAHDLYLKGRFEENQPTAAANQAAQDDYRRALEIDPEYAAAWSALGGAIWNRSIVAGEQPVPAEQALATQQYLKAIQFDPDFAPAHNALGSYAMFFDWDWNRAEREFKTALAAGQSAGAEMNYAFLCLITGRRAEADQHVSRALDLDPVSTQGKSNYVLFLSVEGRNQEQREELRKLAAEYPDSPVWRIQLTVSDATSDHSEAELAKIRKLAQQQPIFEATLGVAEAMAGHREEALRIAHKIEREGPKAMTPLAAIYANVDDEANTVKYLDKAIDLHETAMIYIHLAQSFAKWQDTPEFHRLKKRLNLDW